LFSVFIISPAGWEKIQSYVVLWKCLFILLFLVGTFMYMNSKKTLVEVYGQND
jgi:hypothetical protein